MDRSLEDRTRAAAVVKADRQFGWIYLAVAAVLALVALSQLLVPLRLNSPGADIWQHLATLNAIIEDPLDPANPFVPTDDPSRLFGPYWVAVGMLARAAGWSPLEALVFSGAVNVLLWLGGVFVFGRAFFGDSRGALFLLASLTLGWVWPPSFTGYHSPLAIITGAANPAFLMLGLTLLLWGLSIRHLEQGRDAALLALLPAIAMATHTFGTLVAIAGSAGFALFAIAAPPGRRWRVALLPLGGAALALLWPWYSVPEVLGSARSPGWTTSADFYAGPWLAQSLVPAVFGAAGLVGRRARPLAALLLPCAAGFALGATPQFAAGHRLLPYAVLILHIGLAQLLLSGWEKPRTRWAVAVGAMIIAALQLRWTVTIVGELRRDLAEEGSLLQAAAALTDSIPPNAMIAGHGMASFPVTATGRRVVSTPFAEPMIADLGERQAASEALFRPSLPPRMRARMAAQYCVTHLIADRRMLPTSSAAVLRSEATRMSRAGNLVLFELRAPSAAMSRCQRPGR